MSDVLPSSGPDAPADPADHESRNLARYATTSRIYQWHTHAFHERIAEWVERVAPASILDAGCGEGFATAFLAERMPTARIEGVDVSAGAVAYAQAHFGERVAFRTGSVYALPYEDDSFDLVLCSEVLEHLDRPDDAVKELARVARRHVLMTVPLEPYFDALNRVGRAVGVGGDPGHVNFWTRTGWADFVGRHFGRVETDTRLIYNLALATL